MVIVEFLGPIPKERLELEIANLQELSDILAQDPTLKEWVECSAVAVNDTLVAQKDYPLQDGDKVSLLPPVCGG
ncbi:MAG: MoaD/ThiS family protein [Epsilonproteobacteria bacterium]|nr:MoaD/ThiS family protein [Campylobacterota bacterium]